MTDNQHSGQTDEGTPRPVQGWENARVSGLALLAEPLLNDTMSEVAALRAREAAYKESLPKTDEQAIRAALDILEDDGSTRPPGFHEAMALSFALKSIIAEMIKELPPEEIRQWDGATLIAKRLNELFSNLDGALERVSDTLRNPLILKWDDRVATVGVHKAVREALDS